MISLLFPDSIRGLIGELLEIASFILTSSIET
jgi:hypothetical protein